MLHADKRALEQNLKLHLLLIRERELMFYTDNCVSIGAQAAWLAGFAYAGLIMVDLPVVNQTLETAYLCMTVTAMGLNLIAVLNSMLCSMLGPGLALRGPDGAMHRAVDEMMEEYRLTFFFFGLGLIALYAATILYAWVMFLWPPALLMSFSLAGWMYLTYHYFVRIYTRFKIPPQLMITGRFDTDSSLYELTITAADLRAANEEHREQQTMGAQFQQFLSPVTYARGVLRDRHGPER